MQWTIEYNVIMDIFQVARIRYFLHGKNVIRWFGFDNKNVKISNLDFISHEFDLIVYMLSFEKEMH